MGLEIERRYLVNVDRWQPQGEGIPYRQGYVPTEPGATVRVRLAGDQGRLTLKGPTQGLSRAEFEYPIPADDARALLDQLCRPDQVVKTRHVEVWAGHRWEIDVFGGANAPLVMAEIELGSEDEAFEPPPWLGAEVSLDPRYTNSALAQRPWSTWGRG